MIPLCPVITKQNCKGDGHPKTHAVKAIEQGSEESLPEKLPEFDYGIKGSIFLRKQMANAPYRQGTDNKTCYVDINHLFNASDHQTLLTDQSHRKRASMKRLLQPM